MKNSLKLALALSIALGVGSQAQADNALEIAGKVIKVVEKGVRIFNDVKEAKTELPKLRIEMQNAQKKIREMILLSNKAPTAEEKLKIQAEMLAVFVASLKSFDEQLKLVFHDIIARILEIVEMMPKLGDKMKVTKGGQPVMDPLEPNEQLTKSRQIKNAVQAFDEFVKVLAIVLPQLTKTAAQAGAEAATKATIAAVEESGLTLTDAVEAKATAAAGKAASSALATAGADPKAVAASVATVKAEADAQAQQQAEGLQLDS